MKLLRDKEIDPVQWDAMIAASGLASPFQSRQFHDFFNSVDGLSAIAYGVEDQGKLASLCVVTFQKEKGMKGFFSRRAIIYGGPVADTSHPEALAFLLKNINENLRSKVIYTETRNFYNYAPVKMVFSAAGWEFEPYLNYHLNCSSEETAMSGLNTNRKRQIKKAQKNGALIEEAKSKGEVKEFYDILKNLYTTRIKKPLFDFEFFEKFYETGIGKILLVKKEATVIGGIVCPVLKDRTIYEYYICGLDDEYKDLSPSVMATYAAIEYGFKNGLKRFDFMGAGKPSEDYGVRDFKAKFGGELVEHGRFIKINNKTLYILGKTALTVLQKIKR